MRQGSPSLFVTVVVVFVVVVIVLMRRDTGAAGLPTADGTAIS
jgi:preprotein translocase subunit SecG